LACAESLRFLGITPDDIRYVERIDTETSLKDAVQTDSAVALLLSEAIHDLADDVREQVLAMGARKFEIAKDALAIEEGRIFPKADPGQGVTIKDLFWFHMGYVPIVPIVATVSRSPNMEMTGVPYQATFAEVEVDIETGVVKVLRMVIVNDAGTVLYPTGAEAQQIGGQVLGLGETLSEELVYDPRTGTALNFNLTDYTIFTMKDMPDIEPVLLEVWQGAGKYGASGIGEGTLVNTPGAILNAIYNAVGLRVDHIPVSPADILRGLNDRGYHEDI
jgi:xanthine dehydrogenase molybdenum-binding subunit